MIVKFLCCKNLWAKLCVAALGLALIFACQSRAESDGALLAKDLTAMSDLRRINADLGSIGQITPENFEKLRRLREKYPHSQEIGNTYQAAMISREDWGGLERFLTEGENAGNARDRNILLAKVYIKLGNFERAADLLRSMRIEAPDDVEVRSLSALANFSLERLTEAATDLDGVWNSIVEQKRIDDINLRGMIYFRVKDYERAISVLQQSIQLQPNNPVPTNALSRVYAALGDTAKAESYRLETERAQEQSDLKSSNKVRFVALIKVIETAWNEKRYNDVIATARKMLELSEDKNKAAIVKYITSAEAELKRQNQR